MVREEYQVSLGEGRYSITLSAIITNDGISVTITGGEIPHIGGVAVSVPRKSLRDESISCDTWVCPIPGHKDVEISVPMAEKICRILKQKTVVVAGIHIDNALPAEISALTNNCEKAVSELIEQITKGSEV